MLNLYVLDASLAKIPVFVREASEPDLTATSSWQTNWTSKYVKSLPNKVALCRRDNGELLGLMSYEADGDLLAVEIIYIERKLVDVSSVRTICLSEKRCT